MIPESNLSTLYDVIIGLKDGSKFSVEMDARSFQFLAEIIRSQNILVILKNQDDIFFVGKSEQIVYILAQ